MSEHFKTLCKYCETLITQCRCISENKVVKYGICAKCAKERLQ